MHVFHFNDVSRLAFPVPEPADFTRPPALASDYEIMYISLGSLSCRDPAMAKEAVFTMKLESELRDAFLAAAEAAHRPASQIVRELMRGYIQHRREEREYEEFLRCKVKLGRFSMRAARGRPNDEVAAWRAKAAGKA